MIELGDALRFLILRGPGRTEAQLAEAVFGARGYQQRVNQDLRLLADRGMVERRGQGGQADPFTYWPRS